VAEGWERVSFHTERSDAVFFAVGNGRAFPPRHCEERIDAAIQFVPCDTDSLIDARDLAMIARQVPAGTGPQIKVRK
jgi:hypothetical protein